MMLKNKLKEYSLRKAFREALEIPEDAENIKVEVATTVYRTNKILLKNGGVHNL